MTPKNVQIKELDSYIPNKEYSYFLLEAMKETSLIIEKYKGQTFLVLKFESDFDKSLDFYVIKFKDELNKFGNDRWYLDINWVKEN